MFLQAFRLTLFGVDRQKCENWKCNSTGISGKIKKKKIEEKEEQRKNVDWSGKSKHAISQAQQAISVNV